jgi:catechol 2,3-dioxygenase-like lactoylglutathione lyase family enzyme
MSAEESADRTRARLRLDTQSMYYYGSRISIDRDIRDRLIRPEVTRMATVQVRYIVDDVDAAIAFYCGQLGFREIMHPAPPFAMLSRGDLRLVLSAPNPSGGGGQPMPDGTPQRPGGWNRFAIQVDDLVATVASLRKTGARFRNDIVTGVGGKQILVEDPSGNPVELFQPVAAEARLDQKGPES